MSKAVQRSIEDIGYSARYVAQEAALRLGMSVDDALDPTTADLSYRTMQRLAAARSAAQTALSVAPRVVGSRDARAPSGRVEVPRNAPVDVATATALAASVEPTLDQPKPRAEEPRAPEPIVALAAPGPAPEVAEPDPQASTLRPSKASLVRAAVQTIVRRQAILEATSKSPTIVPPKTQDAVEALWGDIGALLEQARSGTGATSVDRRMKDLADKIECYVAGHGSTALAEGLLARIDALQAARAAPPEERTVGGQPHATTDDVGRLRETIDALSKRIDDTLNVPDPQSLSALHIQVEGLAARLERSETTLSSLDGIHRSLSELFSQMEKARETTIDAAEAAARNAAREAIRDALDAPDLRPREAHGLREVASDLRDLKAQHEACETRTRTSLAGLYQAVERLASQLAVLQHPRPTADREAAPPIAAVESDPPASTAQHQAAPSAPLWPTTAGGDDHDILLEPGAQPRSGRILADTIKAEPPLLRPDGASDALGGGVSAFIAAARTGAQAAQASAEAKRRTTADVDERPTVSDAMMASAIALLDRLRGALAGYLRPVALSAASVALLFGAFEASRMEFPWGERTAATEIDAKPVAEATASLQATPSAATPIVRSSPETTGSITPQSAAPKDAAVVAAAPAPEPPAPAPSAPPSAPPANADAGQHAVAPPQAVASVAAAASGHAEASAAPPPPETIKTADPFLTDGLSASPGLGEGLRLLARAGNPAAQYEVGLRFIQGRTVTRDANQAAVWFEAAAQQGLAPAQYRLGLAYEKGLGKPRDAAMAMTWYGRAAEAGNMRAMHNLAVMTAEAAVGKPDYAKAAGWFEKAATLGVRDSQFNLAVLYARGLGVERNLERSYLWFSLAAVQGDQDAGKKREEVAGRLGPKSLADAKAAFEAFHAGTPIAAANEVAAPVGGWNAIAVSAPTTRRPDKSAARDARF